MLRWILIRFIWNIGFLVLYIIFCNSLWGLFFILRLVFNNLIIGRNLIFFFRILLTWFILNILGLLSLLRFWFRFHLILRLFFTSLIQRLGNLIFLVSRLLAIYLFILDIWFNWTRIFLIIVFLYGIWILIRILCSINNWICIYLFIINWIFRL